MATTTDTPTDKFQLLQLPNDCLRAVLQQLQEATAADDADNNQRGLLRVARAHSRLHATAAAVQPSTLRAVLGSQQQADGTLDFLARQGQYVTSISLSGSWGAVITHLPSQCFSLCSASFRGVQVQLGAGASHEGILQSCGASLTQLELDDRCSLRDDSGACIAAALSGLSGLKRLVLDAVHHWDDEGPAGHGLPGHVWPALAQLSSLSLKAPTLARDAAALAGMTCLAQLQELRLIGSSESQAVILPDVLEELERLTALALHHGRVEPAALAVRSVRRRLQHLELMDVWDTLPAADHHLDNLPANVVLPGPGQMLAQLAGLQKLSTLVLRAGIFSDGLPLHPLEPVEVEPEAYAALTASASTLKSLNLAGCSMPPGAWKHVFRQPTALEQLRVTYRLSSDDITAVVDGAPRLRELSEVDAGTHLSPLSRLVHLSSLRMRGLGPDACATAGVLAQLSGLQDQSICLTSLPRHDTQAALMPFTQLGQLTRLQLARQDIDIKNKAPQGAPPDVPRQLQKLLRARFGCRPPHRAAAGPSPPPVPPRRRGWTGRNGRP